jgi:DNA-binding transcriptional LysR family regulator
MDLRHLEYFVAVATERNFSRAAQRVHVVQSALSAAVNRLEKDLQVTLFDRTRRPIELTAAGAMFLVHAKEVLDAAQRAEHSVYTFRDRLKGTVNVGTLMSWGSMDLPAALAEFRERHPLVTIRLRQSTGGSVGHLAAVADGRLDLALVSLAEPASPSVAVLELSSEPMVFVCSPDHVLADRQVVAQSELEGAELIQFPEGWGIRERLDAAFATAGTQPVIPYEVADYTIAAELVRHRLAATVVPLSAANRFPDLHIAQLNPPMPWTLYLASATVPPIKPPVAELANALSRCAQQ